MPNWDEIRKREDFDFELEFVFSASVPPSLSLWLCQLFLYSYTCFGCRACPVKRCDTHSICDYSSKNHTHACIEWQSSCGRQQQNSSTSSFGITYEFFGFLLLIQTAAWPKWIIGAFSAIFSLFFSLCRVHKYSCCTHVGWRNRGSDSSPNSMLSWRFSFAEVAEFPHPSYVASKRSSADVFIKLFRGRRNYAVVCAY